MKLCEGIRIATLLAVTATMSAPVFALQTLNMKREATVKRIGDEVKMFASDDWEGRGVSTKGIERAANYIRDEFKKFGLKSGVDNGSYFQPFDITLRDMIDDKKSTCTITDGAGKTIQLVKGKDFQPQNAGGDGDLTGDLVFVGYGIEAPDLDYQEYKGVDVKGKVVVVIRREPQQQNKESKFNGTDGIKTGYINASGFNLVATVTRNNVKLIGVVFGGKTSRSRDRHMISILDRQFKRAKTITVRAAAAMPSALPIAPPRRTADLPEVPATLPNSAHIAARSNKPGVSPPFWSVQIGNFAQRANAHKAAIRARRMADDVLGMTPAHLMLVSRGNMPLWRVRFNNLDEGAARAACAALFSAGSPCIAIETRG